jgi:P27 family predicted phage terminase small subunit
MSHRKPSNVKKLQGTYRRDRAPKIEPEPRQGIPHCPSHLTDLEANVWAQLGRHLHDMGVLSEADATALELLVEAYGTYRNAQDVIAKNGLIYQTTTAAGDQMIRPRPEVAIAADSWRRIHKMLVEFGLTPASRTRVEAERPEYDPLLELMNRGSRL